MREVVLAEWNLLEDGETGLFDCGGGSADLAVEIVGCVGVEDDGGGVTVWQVSNCSKDGMRVNIYSCHWRSRQCQKSRRCAGSDDSGSLGQAG